ncbi:MAG: 3-hydroxybutyryl-CoA dehydrogenase [Chloroflexota bacterium]|nr:3-hydroxybutyryl-CoA dehydrogenase [Chloroflexota bacterium]
MAINKVGVCGCGQMGSGIAEVCARAGYQVVVYEIDQSLLDGGLARIEKSLARAVAKAKISEQEKEAALARISGCTATENLRDNDLVIEAVFEDIQTKQHIFSMLDEIVQPDAILATNTSSISVSSIATATDRGDRVIGLHFFNPVPVMPLVEVVPTVLTSEETVGRARAFAESLGKTTVLASDTPGFIVNRLLLAFLIDAIRAYEQGLGSKEDIDNALRLGAGHPMGPLTLCDFIGLDVVAHVADTFFDAYGEARFKAPPLLTQMIAVGHLGRKAGRGFYDYG